MIRDRDGKFTTAFDAAPRTESKRHRPECLDHLLITGTRHLAVVLQEYLAQQDGLRGEVPLLRAISAQPSTGHPLHGPGPPTEREESR